MVLGDGFRRAQDPVVLCPSFINMVNDPICSCATSHRCSLSPRASRFVRPSSGPAANAGRSRTSCDCGKEKRGDVEFRQYSKDGFGWEEQVATAEWLSKHSGPVVLSNQATRRIVELYKGLGYHLIKLNAPRRISCTGDRTPAPEVLAIRNLQASAERADHIDSAELFTSPATRAACESRASRPETLV